MQPIYKKYNSNIFFIIYYNNNNNNFIKVNLMYF